VSLTETVSSRLSKSQVERLESVVESESGTKSEVIRECLMDGVIQREQPQEIPDDARSTDLINGKWVNWRTLSAHPNLKAVKPWILLVTDTDERFGFDGEWLEKKQIDGNYHMDLSPVEQGNIIRVSGASHNNRKHRFYRVVFIDEQTLSYDRMDEASVIEEVGD